MKTLGIFALIALLIVVMSCAPHTKLVNQKAVQVDWLVGKWKQLDKEVYEKWMKVTDAEFLGVSYSMESGTAEIMETMKIFRLAKEWMLEVKLPKASDPVLFKMIPDPGWQLKFPLAGRGLARITASLAQRSRPSFGPWETILPNQCPRYRSSCGEMTSIKTEIVRRS